MLEYEFPEITVISTDMTGILCNSSQFGVGDWNEDDVDYGGSAN